MQIKKVFLGVLCCFMSVAFNTYAQKEVALKDTNAVKELFFAGLRDKMTENYPKAANSFSKIVDIDPQNDAALFELANLYFKQNKFMEAELAIKKAIVIKPANIWYIKLQADVYRRLGNPEALIRVLDQLIALDENDKFYYFDKANALYFSGKKAEAEKLYQDIEQKFGSSKELDMARQRFAFQNKNTAKQKPDETTSTGNYLLIGAQLLENNKPTEALAVLQKAKQAEPQNFEIDLAMADVYQELKQNDAAIAALQNAFNNPEMPLNARLSVLGKVLAKPNSLMKSKNIMDLALNTLKEYPGNTKAMLMYGDLLYQTGNLAASKEQYAKAVKIEPQLYIAWEKLLAVQTLLGNYEEAIKVGDEALTYYPNQAILYYYKAFALHRNGQNAEAAFDIKNALQLDAEDKNLNAMILALQAEVFIDQGKLKEADEAFEKAIAIAPNNYLTMSNYAYYMALRNHNLDKAENLALKAASAHPANASVLDTYAFVLLKQNKLDAALENIRKALQSDPSNGVYIEHHGDILYLKGEKEKALEQWIKAGSNGNASEKLKRKINEKKYIK